MHTDFPAAVSTSAAVAPPGPEPTTTTSNSGTGDLGVAPATRLHVALVRDRPPPADRTVPAILGRPVRGLARVLEHELLQLRLRVQVEIVTEGGDAVPVDLLPAAYRTVPLALGQATRTLDARA